MSGMCFFWRVWAPQAAQHTRTLLGDPKAGKNIFKIQKSPEIYNKIHENLLIPGCIRIPQIPESHYCPDTRIHLPGYKPGYYPPASLILKSQCRERTICFEGLACVATFTLPRGPAGSRRSQENNQFGDPRLTHLGTFSRAPISEKCVVFSIK